MTIKEFIKELEQYHEDTQLVLSGDEECNTILGLWGVEGITLQKSNNVGGFEALLIVPNGITHEVYDDEEN